MFENTLKEDLAKIFKLEKVTYDAPSPDAMEQEVMFVQVDLSRNNVRDTKITSRVEGRLLVFAQAEKMPFSYFEQCIREAEPSLTRKFFFYDITGNSNTLVNLAERSASFIYFNSSQYDPDKGSIESINIECGGDT